jgi:predicted nucleic acid-binding protein
MFLDSSFIVARFTPRDQFHETATQLGLRVDQCKEIWTTEAVLLEIAAAFRAPSQRRAAVRVWDQFHSESRCRLTQISGGLLERGMELFRQSQDKAWSLTDCISFVVMQDQHLTDALSCDHHFLQAGFRALLLEPPPA